MAARFRRLHRLLLNKYYVDEIYDAVIVQPIKRLSIRLLWRGVDAGLIDGTVNGVGLVVRGWSAVLRRLQTGSVRAYAMSLFLGVGRRSWGITCGGECDVVADARSSSLPLVGAAARAARWARGRRQRARARSRSASSLVDLRLSLVVVGAVRPARRRPISSSSATRGCRSSASRITSAWTASACCSSC